MVKMIAVQCPQCGADLDIEEGRKTCFCTYCGAKIMIDDGSKTYTYRKVDEARIKEAEVDERIRLKELEIENRKLGLRHTLIKLWIGIVVVIAVIAILILLFDQDNPDSMGYMLLMIDFNVAMWPALFFFVGKGKDKKDE